MWSATQAAQQPQVEGNAWQRIDILPRQKLTQFITQRCVEMDECRDYIGAKEAVMGSKRKAAMEKAAEQARFHKRKARMRESLLSRHNALSALEEKSGVVKLRSDPVPLSGLDQTPFGLARSHRVSKRCRSLSRPKAQSIPMDPLNYSELKGLLMVEHPSAIAKLKRSVSNIHSYEQGDKDDYRPAVEDNYEGKEAMVAIDQFPNIPNSKGFCGKDLEAVKKAVEESGRSRLTKPTR